MDTIALPGAEFVEAWSIPNLEMQMSKAALAATCVPDQIALVHSCILDDDGLRQVHVVAVIAANVIARGLARAEVTELNQRV